jgi:hypothetical protein
VREGSEVLVNPDTAYERSDVSLKVVGMIAVVIVLTLTFMPLLIALGYPTATSDVDKRPFIAPPAPVLQTDPEADLLQFRAKEKQRLSSYGWIDRAHGVVHIPIEEAMQNIAKQGIPGWPSGEKK